MEITASHERWQEWPGPEAATEPWFEGHRLEIVANDLNRSVMVEMRRYPGAGSSTVRIALLEGGELPIGVIDTELPPPKPANTWEVRGSGIWCEMVCETPLTHWSYGLEAFALAVDGPRDLIDQGIGHRVPLGWELDFEATGPATWLSGACYIQVGDGHGLMLSADGESELEGRARRWHWWGQDEPFLGDVSIERLTELPVGEIWLSDPVERLSLTEAGLSVFRPD